jgi:hypothetical protein
MMRGGVVVGERRAGGKKIGDDEVCSRESAWFACWVVVSGLAAAVGRPIAASLSSHESIIL